MKALAPVAVHEKKDFTYEVKFLIPEAVADAALVWARKHLTADPHIDPSKGDTYTVNSLYFDTPQFDVYQRNGSFGRCKYRVRRYASETTLFLERKLKTRGLVGKRRTRVPEEEMVFLNHHPAPANWAGSWFQRRLLARQLEPQCQIAYQRVARVGQSAEGLVRLTLDHQVRCVRLTDVALPKEVAGLALIPSHAILELKFQGVTPELFKTLMQDLELIPQAISKYRLSIQAFGLDASLNPSPTENDAPVIPPSGHNGEVRTEPLILNPSPEPQALANPVRG